MTRTTTLAALAYDMGLAPADAVALPAVIEVSARKAGMFEAAFLAEVKANAPLRSYLASVCRCAARSL
jgi:hypothetical protein